MTRDLNTQIASRAYEIWEHEGRPNGKALDHWLRAEAELQETDREAISSRQDPRQPTPHRESAPVERPRARRRKRTRQVPPKESS